MVNLIQNEYKSRLEIINFINKNIDTINNLIRDLKCGQLLVKPKFSSRPQPLESLELLKSKEDFFTVKEVD
jgi:hypothetical protein